MSQPGLFALPDEPPLPRSSTIDRGRAGRPTWADYRPKNRVACDECILVLHENRGIGPYPRSARWTRTSRDRNGNILRARLCQEHAVEWKKDDGQWRAYETDKRKRYGQQHK